MALNVGTRLGSYEITSAIGAGGMGEVYRARDMKLDREVAIKILPELFAADPERVARFTREAKTLAALNHPHIAQIYGLEESHGISALVMELVEGSTLADLIAKRASQAPAARASSESSTLRQAQGCPEQRRGASSAARASGGGAPRALEIAEALAIAKQIAEALEAAHEHGIIHRDLKPANVKVRDDGTVKVLDFGLAKALDPVTSAAGGLTNSPTITSPAAMTHQGVILGTAAYMAPEQAKGRLVDKRADIWAFGCVLYEMLTGRRAFPGEDVTDTIVSVLSKEPAWDALPPAASPNIRKLLRRCLVKDHRQRLGDMRDARLEIEDALGGAAEPQPVAATSARTPRRERLAWAVAVTVLAVALVALGRVAYLGRGSAPASPEVTRALISVAPADQLLSGFTDLTSPEGRPSRTAMALSPDGRTLVFSAVRGGTQQLYVRALDQLEAVPLAGTEGANSPFFSPDGKSVGFWANDALKKVALSGGPATTICETAAIFGASWGSNDTILFARIREGLWQVPAAGGTPQPLTTLDTTKGEVSHRLPQILPGNQVVVFTVTHDPGPKWDETEIVVQSLVTGERKTLGRGADARYVPTGHLVYVRAGTLVAVPFDLERLQVTGGAVTVMADVMQAANLPYTLDDSGAGQFSVSASGALAYLAGGIFPDLERTLVWVDRTGATQSIPIPARAYISPRLSPDGQRLAVRTIGTDQNVWVYDIPRGTLTRLTTEGRNGWSIWTPDGKRVAYSARPGADNLFWKPADGSGAVQRLATSEYVQTPSSWSPDGQTLAFVESRPAATTGYDIWVLPLGGDRQPRPILQTRFNETYPEFSPDGRWLAYVSDESGRNEVYVQPYPGPGPRQQVSIDGGIAPAWSRDGKELFYLNAVPSTGGQATAHRLMAVSVTPGPSLTFGVPRILFQRQGGGSTPIRGYDVTPDGRRFLMVEVKERPPIKATQMILVQNWVEELKRRVGGNR